jgi:PAS domain S-box-containing protein
MPKSMPWSEPPAVLSYGAAIAAVAAAIAVGSLLQQMGGSAPAVSLLLCGVLFAAWFGGLGPGLLAITSGLLAFDYFFLPPLYSLAVQDYNDVVRLIAFAVAAVFVLALSAKQTSIARELERMNASLRDENAERQRAEAELRQSEKNLQTIVNTIPAYVARYRADGTPDFVNQTLREFLGPDAVIDQMRSTVHPDDVRQNWRDWRAHVAAGEPYENEMRLRRADGVYRWHRIRRVPLRDANGTIVNWYGAGHDIDDQKRAETALRESEKSLQTIIDTIPAHVVRYRADGAPDFVNQTLREFVGVGLDEMPGTVHPDDLPQNLRNWRAHVAAREPYEHEMRVRRADGVYRWHRMRRVPLRDANGAIVSWYGAGHDVDDQKRAETALRESEYKLRQIIETVPGLLWSADSDGETTYVNQRIVDYIGKSFEDFKHGGWGAFVHPDDLPETEKAFSHAIQTGTSHEAVHRLRQSGGEYRWHHTRAEALRDQQGRTIQWYGLSVDIDEGKKAEERLRRSEALLAEAERLSHSCASAYNATTILYWSDETYRIFGFDPRDGLPSREAVWQRIHPDDRNRVRAEVENAQSGKGGFSSEFRIVLPDGTVKYVESIRQPVFSPNGELIEVVATQIDVTERKLAEDALRERETQLAEARRELQQTIDTIPILVASYSAGAKRDFVNAAWKQYTGLSDEAALGTEWSTVAHPDEIAIGEKVWCDTLARGEPLHVEARLRRADGQYRWHAVDRVALRDESGKVTKWYSTGYDIEDRKRAEAALRESEKSLQTIIDTIPAHVVRFRANGTPEFINQTLRKFIGVEIADVRSSVHPEDLTRHLREWYAHVPTGEPYEGEVRLRGADGAYRWQLVRRVPLRDANGAVVNWYGVEFDIEDRKRAEAALREREAQLGEAQRELQQTIDIIPLQVARYSPDFRREFVNTAWKEFTGVSDEAAGGTGWSSAVHPDDLATAEKGWRDAALAEGEPTYVEARLRRADGQYRWFAVYRVALRDESGTIAKWYSTGYDIEERKQAEDLLRRSEAHLAEAQRLSHTGAVTYNGTATVYASEETFHIWGFDPAQGLPSRDVVFQRIHPGDRDRLNAEVRRAVSEKKRFSIGYRIVLPDGTVKHLETIGQPVFSASGKLVEIVATQTDVTDRKRAEDALRRSEAYLAEAQRLSCTGSFGWRIADNLIVWSRETYRIFELDPAVKPTLELVLGYTHPDDIDRVQRMIERMANDERDLDYEHRLLLPNGTIKQLHVRTYRIRFESGETEVVGALMDITDARKAEEALRRAQAELAHASRVATLGELSASIVHEVNQPLSSIVASGQAAVRWLDRDVPEKERAHRSIVRLLSEAERAGQVIRRIRDLAKKAEPEMTQVDINSLVADVMMLVHREAVGQRVAVRTQLASELPPVRGDRIQLQQVLINLAINGIQAMASVTDRARVLVIRTQRYGDDELLVAVEDAGVGIAPENLPRLFSAFYTTKPDGMGMGLSISRSIVEAHGGRLSATCNSGAGMTFQFTLSLYREQDTASSPVS